MVASPRAAAFSWHVLGAFANKTRGLSARRLLGEHAMLPNSSFKARLFNAAVAALAASGALRAVRAAPTTPDAATTSDVGDAVAIPDNSVHRLVARKEANNESPNIVGEEPPPGFSLTDPATALANPASQPLGFSDTDTGCHFKVSTINIPHTTTNADGWMSVDDVDQQSLGDCGVGAAMIALRDNNARGLRNMLTSGSNTKDLQFRFYYNSKSTVVHIDDKLPFDPDCSTGQLGSFQITNNNAYVPLTEKALAKFFDAYPDLRNTKTPGYAGLINIDAATVMSAISNVRAIRVLHPVSPNHSSMVLSYTNAIIKCMNDKHPCTLATPTVEGLARVYNLPGVTSFDTAAARQIRFDDDMVSFFDVDQNVSVQLEGRHWYALLRSKGPNNIPATASANTPNNIILTLRNPWGHNPHPTGRDSAEVRVSLRALAAVTVQVGTLG
jgi:hypothetical protein